MRDTTIEAATRTGQKPRGERETALRLINPTEYAIAERMYEGDSYLIAQALDVTVQVVEDYKEMLHDSVAV